jgi:hypothetical protein
MRADVSVGTGKSLYFNAYCLTCLFEIGVTAAHSADMPEPIRRTERPLRGSAGFPITPSGFGRVPLLTPSAFQNVRSAALSFSEIRLSRHQAARTLGRTPQKEFLRKLFWRALNAVHALDWQVASFDLKSGRHRRAHRHPR